jgi:hypothetical protein
MQLLLPTRHGRFFCWLPYTDVRQLVDTSRESLLVEEPRAQASDAPLVLGSAVELDADLLAEVARHHSASTPLLQ